VQASASGTFTGNSVNGASSTASTATCPADHPKLLGGGAVITQGANAQAAIQTSAPTPTTGTPTGWTATAVQVANNGSNGNRATITAYAVCGV
jgi:hypothetical protein